MSTTKLRDGTVLLPSDVRDALGLEEGEILEVEMVANGVLLRRKPLTTEERARAWDDVLAVVDLPKGADPEDPDALEAEIFEEVKDRRRAGTAGD